MASVPEMPAVKAGCVAFGAHSPTLYLITENIFFKSYGLAIETGICTSTNPAIKRTVGHGPTVKLPGGFKADIR